MTEDFDEQKAMSDAADTALNYVYTDDMRTALNITKGSTEDKLIMNNLTIMFFRGMIYERSLKSRNYVR